MPRNTIELEFADGVYLFALPAPRIDELQTKCGIGIGGLFARVLRGVARVGEEIILAPAQGEYYAADIIETIRQGLIGGNHGLVDEKEIPVSAALANRLVTNYVLDRPLSDSWSLAASILGAAIVGYDPPKKEQAGKSPAGEQMDGLTILSS